MCVQTVTESQSFLLVHIDEMKQTQRKTYMVGCSVTDYTKKKGWEPFDVHTMTGSQRHKDHKKDFNWQALWTTKCFMLSTVLQAT